jgi:hypothetical protein
MQTNNGSKDVYLSAHEAVCTERYGNINQQLLQIKQSMSEFETQMHERLNIISNRMWQGVLGVLSVTTVAFAAAVVYWIESLRHVPK